MRTCPSCGQSNAPDARFCTRCATPLEGRRCRSCAADLPAGARFCPACAAPVADPRDEERKLVTILFADVTGSTALGERLDPERVRAVLSAYFSSASAAIEAWGGTVEKYIGDAIMAVFGVPVVREDDAARALHAALDILDRLPELNRRFEAQHGVTLSVRSGVNSGEVIAPVGAMEQLIVTGDAVNVAARLEQAAEPGSVLVGERTYLATRDAFRFEGPIDLELKGKGASVRAYRLLGASAEATRGIPGLRSAMVGRDRELESLARALADVVEAGSPSLALVTGPAGIGKSRLVIEFVRQARSLPRPTTVLRGRCLAGGRGGPYWALAEVLRGLCDISLDEPAESARDKLRERAGAAMDRLGLSEAEHAATIFALATTAGISLPDNPLDRLEPAAVADELGQAWPRLLSALARSGTCVLVVEDLHWASDELTAMLERALARSAGPLLIVATARPEFATERPGFGGAHAPTTIPLRPLSERQSADLVDSLLDVADLPAALRHEILQKADGNPYFLEEILRRLIDEGALARSGDRWQATAAAGSIVLPDTVHGLLAARIDALPADEKRILQEAAVMGRVFWPEPVRRTLGDGDIEAGLLRLERKGFIAARPTSTIGGQVEFTFKHALLRDVAYAGLPKTRRARSNAAAAAWLEELAPDRSDEVLDIVANHYAAAALDEDADLAWSDDPAERERVRRRAFETLMAAGDAARRRYALKDALAHHRRAHRLTTGEERGVAWEAIADDEDAAFHGDEAWSAYNEAMAAARARGDRAAIARMAVKAARVSTKIGTFTTRPDPAAVERLVEEGLAAVEDAETRARLLMARGSWVREMWDGLEGRDPVPVERRLLDAEEAVRIAARLGQPQLELEAEDARGALHWLSGDFEAAIASNRRQVELAERVGSRAARALAYYQASHTLRDTGGDYRGGLELARRSYDEALHLSPHELMHGTAQWMIAAYYLGRWDDIEPRLAEHLVAFEDERDRSCSSVRSGPAIAALMRAHRGDAEGARALLALVRERSFGYDSPIAIAALAHVALGDPDEALIRLEGSSAGRSRIGMRFVLVGLVETLVALGRWADLPAVLASSREASGQMRLIGPVADRAEGRMLLAQGDRAGAEAALRRAVAGFDELGTPFEAALAREQLALAVTGTDEARSLREAALEVFRALDARPHVERLEAIAGAA
ncbi:MAG TPA: adenylate/guanylate cyclase domain-containing protein [Candidatus Limnocylindrales bacterium]|nr:adenylate/guanylate cyclase domain-containing protein [Candidatus Limnocylindrales bacterium]